MKNRSGIRIARIVHEWRPRGGEIRAFAAGLCGRGDLEFLKTSAGSRVARATFGSQPIVVKWRELRTLQDRAKCLVGASRAFRQWRGARLLARAGVPAARPLALLVQNGRAGEDGTEYPAVRATAPRWGGACPSEWLLLEDVPGSTVLRHLADARLPVRDQHTLARAVGVQVGAMLRAGLTNRDHKPSNLIANFEDGVPIVTLLDTVAIRRRSNPGEMVRMLATLLIETIGVGVPPRSAIAFRVLRDACAAWLEGTLARPLGSHKGDRKALRLLVRSTARRIDQYVQTHGDPTPADNPLEPPSPRSGGVGLG